MKETDFQKYLDRYEELANEAFDIRSGCYFPNSGVDIARILIKIFFERARYDVRICSLELKEAHPGKGEQRDKEREIWCWEPLLIAIDQFMRRASAVAIAPNLRILLRGADSLPTSHPINKIYNDYKGRVLIRSSKLMQDEPSYIIGDNHALRIEKNPSAELFEADACAFDPKGVARIGGKFDYIFHDKAKSNEVKWLSEI